ncbi:MAG TPA: glycoside hydrolase family 88 protein [Bacteroidales bacterium]|nr:glycoside hydrolase family 88 protein [Bacteroidales bacterium]
MKNVSSFALILLLSFFTTCGSNPDRIKGSADTEEKVKPISDTLPWSQRMAESLMVLFPEMWRMEERNSPVWSYTYGLVGMSMQKLYDRTGMDRYYIYSKKYIDTMINDKGVIRTYRFNDFNIDHINTGKMLFMLYDKTMDDRYKIAMDTLRKQLVYHPRTKTGGFWHKKRYPHQMWLDGVYMGAPFMAQYAVQFNEPALFDDLTNWIIAVEEKTRDNQTGLLFHGWDESRQQKWADPETGHSPHFWGRAMGWYAMALVDVLDYLPAGHPKYNDIVAILNRLSEAVVKVQDNETGLWYQVLDQGAREGNYLEGSVSCMLAYTLLKASRLGYIDMSYRDAAFKAYSGIVDHLIKVDQDGILTITPACAVAGLGGDPYRDGSYEYYVNEQKRDNDPKATGPFILASLEFEAFINK